MEIEIKLAPVLPQQAQAVFADGLVAPFLAAPRRIRMKTEYFDNAAGDLMAGGMALRLRQEDGVSLCTFKAETVPGGPREELEAQAETLDAGVHLLLGRQDLPARARAILQGGGLEKICSLSFVRSCAVYQHQGLVFELCHDEGQSQKGARTGAINEIELELISGDEAQMQAIAQALCRRHGLQVSGISKLRQAMALGQQDAGRQVSPFFVSSELLNYCIKQGYLTLDMDEEKRLHYVLTPLGAEELPRRFGVNFGKPCAFAEEGAGDEE